MSVISFVLRAKIYRRSGKSIYCSSIPVGRVGIGNCVYQWLALSLYGLLLIVSSSGKKPCQSCRKNVDAAGERLSNLRVGAEFLPEADHDERVDDSVEVTFHLRAILGK